jgi:hypothetical protein
MVTVYQKLEAKSMDLHRYDGIISPIKLDFVVDCYSYLKAFNAEIFVALFAG